MSEAGTQPPNPDEATNPAEFVTALRALREWSGLTYRELAAKADASGDALPSSTIASALSRTTLPRQQVVQSFARACGLGDAAAARWVAVRNRLAVGPISSGSPDPVEEAEVATAEPVAPPAPAARPRRSRRAIVVIAALAAVIGSGTALAWKGTLGSDGSNGSGGRAVESSGASTPATAALPDGWYLIQPAHVRDRDLCLGEGRERNGRTDRPLAVQRACDRISPDTFLKAVGVGVYEIEWHHPKEGAGCLTVDEALTGDGALLAPDNCTGAAHQRYLLEATNVPVPGGYRLRPIHSGLCVGALGGPADVNPGAEAMQANCTGALDQEFLFVATKQAGRSS
ncbi:helix-turn-helix domain-containing protein [Micromonospora sp. CA-246542]|uniref:helix-turn-helix domain-containing protein n=1 Tax=Micromonospora sp. CA-246542 TaxID=3239959 RepID=UPI003D8FD44F